MNSDKVKTFPELTLQGVSVLVTRPLEYCQNLVELIEQSGGNAIVLPTIEISFTADASEIQRVISHGYNWAIFSSRNAVAAVADSMRTNQMIWPEHLQAAAVGPKTANSVKDAFDLRNVVHPVERYGADALLNLKEMKRLEHLKLALFDGGEGTGILTNNLKPRCKEFSHQVVYSRKLPEIDITPVAKMIKSNIIDFVVITSVNGAAFLFKMLGAELANLLRKSCFVVYSQRIAQYLLGQGFDKVRVAPIASDEAVISSIVRI